MKTAYQTDTSTPPKWANAGGCMVTVKTALGVMASALRTKSDKPWTLYTPDGDQGHLPCSYNDAQVADYLKVLIKTAIVRLLASIREEQPDCRTPLTPADVTDTLLTELRLMGTGAASSKREAN